MLFVHCDYFKYKDVRKTKIAEEKEKGIQEFKDVILILTCIEKQDENRKEEVINKFLEDLKVFTSKLNCNNILLYPYAHLSNSLSNPIFAKNLMVEMENRIKNTNSKIHRASFGWYKTFELKAKGHPLSEAYREY